MAVGSQSYLTHAVRVPENLMTGEVERRTGALTKADQPFGFDAVHGDERPHHDIVLAGVAVQQR
jgi:hypothetical protein